jgi:hypothetical protein
MIAEGRIEYKCSACDSRHNPNASMRVSTAAAKVERVLRIGLRAYKTRRAVCIKAKTTRNNCKGISRFNELTSWKVDKKNGTQ